MTNWLKKARAKCCYCDDLHMAEDLCPYAWSGEHQRTAAKMQEMWEAALDAVLATTDRDADGLAFAHGHIAISVKAVEALRQRGPADAD